MEAKRGALSFNVPRQDRNLRLPLARSAVHHLIYYSPFTIHRLPFTMSPVSIHPTAVVSPRAEIASDALIGPYVVIEDDVVIGEGCEIASHAVIKQFTTLGRGNRIFEHAVLGGLPQDVKFEGEASRLVVGEFNIIREGVTLHRASGRARETRIGSRNFLMIGVHIAHNCVIGDDNTFANEVALAGHIEIEDHVFLSNGVGAHQFVRMGRHAMVGGKSKIVQDVLPFFITDGNPSRVRGVNTVGLRRAGFSNEARRSLKEAYKILFRSDLPLEVALLRMADLNDDNVDHLISFIHASRRGFIRARGVGPTVEEEPLPV
ncbi:MAG: UDP-N-acetylglucosamine acyltransferase [Acidobacteriota bacterium]|jgi:UDP-N-acetylglucosamine acyltransferase|nr:UDP-N-acetylglucosamine acyltransferase [Acidobacteriota bacterium]